MAGTDKPKKYKFEYDPWKECKGKSGDAQKWAEGIKEGKAIKAIKFDLTPSAALNDRKWPEKKVQDESYFGKPKMGFIMFAQQVAQLKDDKKVSEKDKGKELKSLYDELCKDIEDSVKDWLEEVASGKADSAKALKDGKAAMDKIKGVKFEGAFDKPRKDCVGALKGALKGGKVDEKELEKAKKILETAKSGMQDTTKVAQKAVTFLVKSSKSTTKDKDVDKSLQDFGKEVLQNEKDFDSFLEGADEFDEVLEEALAAAGNGMDEKKLGDLIKKFDSLSGLEKKAQDCMKLVNGLLPKFKKIESKMK